MSNLVILNGDNVTSIVDRERDVRLLETEIRTCEPTDANFIRHATRYLELGMPIKAQLTLNLLSADYFDSGIYKDLFYAMFSNHVASTGVALSPSGHRDGAFLSVVKDALEKFDQLSFRQKPAFYRFRKSFSSYADSIVKV